MIKRGELIRLALFAEPNYEFKAIRIVLNIFILAAATT